ncbi:MAG: acetylxylan esterase [Propionibacteriaceae bacterium]|jgi:cephalosporin-C deacetylase|nr:acetylxylan esterase [Propionibacteriaceae bacterium]
MLHDLPLAELENYQGKAVLPDDFASFWKATLAESRGLRQPVQLSRMETVLSVIDVYDVTFSGFMGDPIKAWLRVPHGASGPLPAVVDYVGYNGGRGHSLSALHFAGAGFAHFQMDSRGQGSVWSVGDTADPWPSGPQVPGVMTKGIETKEGYYYRRLLTDAVLAVDACAELACVDPQRVFITGGSQGGAMTVAVAGLSDSVLAASARVPFLSDIRRAVELTDEKPYSELTEYLACHRDRVEGVYGVLDYFDSVNFAQQARIPIHLTVGLMDVICPPSTVYAVYNNYLGPKELQVWSHNGHESGELLDDVASIEFFQRQSR